MIRSNLNKIPYVKTDDLAELKSNIEQMKKNYLKPDGKWLSEIMGREIFQSTGEKMPAINLDTNADKPDKTDFINVQKVYGSLRNLSDSKATDERIWSALALGPFYKYVKYRWFGKKNSKEIKKDAIEEKFFLKGSSRRSLLRNAISRLWWIGRLTYDPTRKDPWELTKYICQHSDYIFHILERNTSNNLRILREFIEALIEGENEGLVVNTDIVGELSKYLQVLGGISVLDMLPDNTIKNKILSRLRVINNNRKAKSKKSTEYQE